MDSTVAQARAAAAPGTPNGGGRLQGFASELRMSTVQRNGQEKVRLEGYASMVERAYEMWDMFGEYQEVISRTAFDKTLAMNPDVSFLVNHKGVTMARTTNGTLELSADPMGLRSIAYLNPERQDVRDLVAAIRDGDITEMSFAFMIDEGGGEWNDEFTQYRINSVSLDRGDVSAVNYGANPYTSIAARSQEILSSLDQLPAGAQRAAVDRLARVIDNRGAIGVKHTPIVDKVWDGGAAEKNLKDGDTSAYRSCYAWVDGSGDPKMKGSYKFPHHEVGSDGTVGAANINGVRNALARLSSAHIPPADMAGVKAHLNAHMNDFHGGAEKAAAHQEWGRDVRLVEALLDI